MELSKGEDAKVISAVAVRQTFCFFRFYVGDMLVGLHFLAAWWFSRAE